MAWLESRSCQECTAAASHILRDKRNDVFGRYCGRHAPAALKRLQKQEEDDRR